MTRKDVVVMKFDPAISNIDPANAVLDIVQVNHRIVHCRHRLGFVLFVMKCSLPLHDHLRGSW